jgi:O-antigen ligase
MSKKYLSHILPDLLLLLFLTIVATTYDHTARLAPEALLTVIQLGLLWFFCRTLFFVFPKLLRYVAYTILLVGVIQAVWGLGQLYGFFPLRHTLFRTTGSFFNSGPYGGFLALMFPLALHFWLHFKRKNSAWRYAFLAVGIICMLVFPATLSRTAWIAAVIGCVWVLVFDMDIVTRLKNIYYRHRKIVLLCTVAFCLLSAVAAYGVFHLKTDSANGRLFMWKITTLAIAEAPITGAGLGGFPAAYAEAQMAYFKSGRATETEKWVAGSPEYAFNEYLRIFLEQGVLGGVLFLLLIFFILKKGIGNRQTGAAGSFLALSVFAFASYPFYLWEFLVAWVVLATICVSGREKETKNSPKTYILASLFVCALLTTSFFVAQHQKTYREAHSEWERVRPLFAMQAHERIVDNYERLFPMLSHNPRFVFEYAMILNATEQREKAADVLRRGLQISNDPMFFNVKGRNYHEMGEFDRAEAALLNSTHLLPHRIYPFYLLALLYADSANFQPERMKWAARMVLEKEPKVHSTAIDEMREEVREMLLNVDASTPFSNQTKLNCALHK